MTKNKVQLQSAFCWFWGAPGYPQQTRIRGSSLPFFGARGGRGGVLNHLLEEDHLLEDHLLKQKSENRVKLLIACN